MDGCLSCEFINRRDIGKAPLWDDIHRTRFWDLAHAYNTSLLGWLVLIARRHIASIDEMTEEEAAEMGKLVRQVSIVLKAQTGCVKTYVCQFAEAQSHQHVHFHIIPRMVDQPTDYKGPGIFKYLGVPEEERVRESLMDNFSLQIRQQLLNC